MTRYPDVTVRLTGRRERRYEETYDAPEGKRLIRVDLDADRSARYGIYVLRDGEPHRVAECDLEAIGTTLVILAGERREAGETTAEVYGVLDQEERRWISGLWPGRSS